jgi:hypothetical protein
MVAGQPLIPQLFSFHCGHENNQEVVVLVINAQQLLFSDSGVTLNHFPDF